LGEMGLLLGIWVKLHLLCSTNRVPLSYELTPANVAEVRLTEELLEAANLDGSLARRLFGDLAYRSEVLERALAEAGIVLVTERSRQHGKRQQVEVALASLKREFRLGETLATTLVGLATRIAAKIAAYTYGFYVNRIMDRPQGHIKELWA
jgi:Transposase DDE domain